MRKYLLYIVMMCLSVSVFAQDKKQGKQEPPTPVKNVLRDARAAIKNKRDQAKHESNLQKVLERDNLTDKERAEILFTQSLLNISLNDAENMKAYLKQKYDTASYFNTLLKASQYAIRCDSIDARPDKKGKVKPLFRSKNRAMLLKYRNNLFAGGRFYLRKNDFKSAVPFFCLYIDMLEEPMLSNDVALLGDSLLKRCSFYATIAGYNSNQPRIALKYIDDALANCERRRRAHLQEYKTRCFQAIGDSVNWLDALYDGCEDYPTHDYFFTHLVEHFEEKHQYDYGLELADTMLSRVQDIPLYWYAKSLMYLHKEDWAKCIEMSDSTIRRDSVHVDAIRNKGLSILNQAMEFGETACYDMSDEKCRRDRQILNEFYQRARRPFERLRELVPDKKEIWASALYRIYLNLNMGNEFAEIEKLLKN